MALLSTEMVIRGGGVIRGGHFVFVWVAGAPFTLLRTLVRGEFTSLEMIGSVVTL